MRFFEKWVCRRKRALAVGLWICVFYLGRAVLTLYLYFLQVDTWEEVNLFNYLPLALYKSIFLFFCCFVGLYVVFMVLYFWAYTTTTVGALKNILRHRKKRKEKHKRRL